MISCYCGRLRSHKFFYFILFYFIYCFTFIFLYLFIYLFCCSLCVSVCSFVCSDSLLYTFFSFFLFYMVFIHVIVHVNLIQFLVRRAVCYRLLGNSTQSKSKFHHQTCSKLTSSLRRHRVSWQHQLNVVQYLARGSLGTRALSAYVRCSIIFP